MVQGMMIALGVRGLPRGEYDRFLIATPPFGVGGSTRLPLGESETPLGGSILVSPVGEKLPVGESMVSPGGGGLPRWGKAPPLWGV